MSFSQAWQNAANETIEPSKGTYNVRIAGGNAFTSQAGDDYCKLDLEIVTAPAGAHVNGSPDKPIGPGSRFEHFMGFKHEVGARINREALITYGLENPESIRSIEDLDDQIARLKGRTADVSVGYKDGYIQIRVSGSRAPADQAQSDIPTNGVYTDGIQAAKDQQADFAAQAAAQTDDTLPFHHIDVSWDDRYHSAR